MKKQIYFLFLTIYFYTFNAFGNSNLSAQYSCYASLLGKVNKASFLLENDTILLPENNGFKKGFYLYTDKTAYFCELPAHPVSKNAQFDHYYLNLKIGNAQRIYMTYSDDRKHKKNPTIATSTQQPTSAVKYEIVTCRTDLTDETRSLLMTELKSRVSSTYLTFKSHKEIAKRQPAQVENPHAYTKALNQCLNISELESDVSQEIAKFIDADEKNNQQPSTGMSR